jgi:hypothetical protein
VVVIRRVFWALLLAGGVVAGYGSAIHEAMGGGWHCPHDAAPATAPAP